MKRRQVLLGGMAGAVACGPAWAASPAPGDAVCAWTDADLFVGAADGRLHTLQLARAPGIAPAPARTGLWVALQGGAVERWVAPEGAGMPWRAAERHRFDEPVHALVADEEGAHVLVAHGERITVIGSGRGVLRRLDGRSLDGRLRGRATTLLALPQRRSAVASLPALAEVWEISFDPQAPPIFDGLVHDYRMGESLPSPGYLGARRMPMQQPLPEFVYSDRRVSWIAGRVAQGVSIVHLDVRRQIALLAMPGARPERALLLGEPGAWRWWVPAGDVAHCIDAMRWVQLEVVPMAEAPAPVRLLHSLADVPWAQAASPSRVAVARQGALQVFDAQGQVLQRWPLPAGSVVQGVRWMP